MDIDGSDALLAGVKLFRISTACVGSQLYFVFEQKTKKRLCRKKENN